MSCVLFPFLRLTMGHPPPVCQIVLAGSVELLFWVELLAGLIGSIMLSRTTHYRYRPIQDA